MRRLALFSAATAASCLLGIYLSMPFAFMLGTLFLCAFLLLCRFWPSRPAFRLISLGLSFGFLWLTAYSAIFYLPAQRLENQTIRMEAEVTGWPSATDYGISVPIRGGEAGSGRNISMLLYLDAEFSAVAPGDTVRAVAHLTSTSKIRGQEVLTHRSKGIYLFAKVYGSVTVTPAQGISPRYYPVYLANKIRTITDRLYAPDSAGYLHAMLTGWKGGISDDDQAALNRTGLSHVVVVSGMHIAFLSGALMLLLGRNRKRTVVIQILVIFFFALMAGSGPGVMRAAIFCSAGLIAPLLGRRADSVTSLFGALLLLLLQNPYAIVNVGLQFSFASILGIYLVGQPLYRHWHESLSKHRLLSRLPASVLSTTLGAIVFTLPLGAFYFGRVSLIAPVTNLLTHWAVSFSFFGGILSVLAGMLWLPLGSLFAAVVNLPIAFFFCCVRGFAKLPFAALTLDSVYYQAFLVFLYAILLSYAFWWQKGHRRILIPACACVMALCTALLLTSFTAYRTSLTLWVLDVGQGQSVALQSGSYRALIDCGGSKQAGALASAHFQSLGASSLDLLILTHYDADHINGVSALLGSLSVGAIALPDTGKTQPERLEIEALAKEHGVQIWYITTETHIPFGQAELTIYPPLGLETEGNEAGLAILCTEGEWDALITGDMGSETEEKLLATHDLPDLELLVLGHHGSRHSTSAALLEALSPDWAIISVGYNNYNHPDPETLQRLRDAQVTPYRTDRMGTVTVSVGK